MLEIPKFVNITTNRYDAKKLGLAYEYGQKYATDRSTKNGALLLDEYGKFISFGACGLLPGLKDLPERHERPKKYLFTAHAERDAIYSAAKRGIATLGSTLYVPWYSCAPCAIAIVSAGIEKVIGHEAAMLRTPEHWIGDIQAAFEILQESGVEMFLHRGEIGGVEMLMNGERWCP